MDLAEAEAGGWVEIDFAFENGKMGAINRGSLEWRRGTVLSCMSLLQRYLWILLVLSGRREEADAYVFSKFYDTNAMHTECKK